MPRQIKTILPMALFTAAILMAAATPLRAQVPNLDQSVFIEGLADRGYAELLERLVVIEPPRDEPTRLHVHIASRRLNFRDLTNQSRQLLEGELTNEAAEQAEQLVQLAAVEYEQMLELMDRLGEAGQQEALLPMWQVDHANALLNEYLTQVYTAAANQYLFGVYSQQQAEVFSRAATDALAILAMADRGFFDRETSLPRQPEHQAQRVNTGLWDRFIDDYWRRMLPFYAAQAAFYVAMLPDSDPFYQALEQGGDPRIRNQASNPADERRRLLESVVTNIDQFMEQGGARTTSSRLLANSIKGMALMEMDQRGQGLELLQEVLDAQPEQIYTVWAGIALARDTAGQGATAQEIAEQFERLAHVEFVRQAPLVRIMLADAEHRLLTDTFVATASEDARDQAVRLSYEPYYRLFEDRRLGPHLTSARFTVYRRWADQAKGVEDLATLPEAVRFGIGEIHFADGQRAYQRFEATPAEDVQARARVLEQMREHLEPAARAFAALEDPEVPAAIRAPAMFQRGLAIYMPNQQDMDKILQACSIWTRQGEAMPEHPTSLQAIDLAARLMAFYHITESTREVAEPQFMRTIQVLVEHFPQATETHNQMVYFGQVLRDDNRWGQAAMIFDMVPPDHRDYYLAQLNYFDALTEMLQMVSVPGESAEDGGGERTISLGRAVVAEGPAWAQGDQAALIARIEEAAAELATEVNDELSRNPDNFNARRALGASILARAEVARVQDQRERELALLDGFASDYAGDDFLVTSAYGRQILAMIEIERYDQASTTASEMMRQYPDAAAAVISEILNTIEERVAAMQEAAAQDNVEVRANRLRQRAQAIGSQAEPLSDLLLAWAETQNLEGEQLAPYKLLQARGKRMAGKGQEAADIMQELLVLAPNDPNVITEAAEALFQAGTPESLREAQGLYYRLIVGLRQERPLPAPFWNAWMRWLEAAAALGQTNDISLRVRQLQAQVDENLGGSPYREVMLRLAEQYPR